MIILWHDIILFLLLLLFLFSTFPLLVTAIILELLDMHSLSHKSSGLAPK